MKICRLRERDKRIQEQQEKDKNIPEEYLTLPILLPVSLKTILDFF
jgi:hypothetical protein